MVRKSDKKQLTVVHNGEHISVSIIPNEFSLGDFDSWIRTRLGLNTDDKVKYTNGNGEGSHKMIQNSRYSNLLILILS